MKKSMIIISFIIVIAVMSLILVFMRTDKIEQSLTEDEIKFKEEYEVNNGVELFEDYILKTVDITSDNNVKYVGDKDIIELLTNGTNVIYFGWSDCNWCRSIVPTLIDTVKENNIDTLYYYDFKELRTSYENSTDKEKTKIYEEILNVIGEDIDSVFNEESKKSGEKKILAPTVVFIKDGQYIGLHVKSVDSQEKATDELSKNEIKELKMKYQELINLLKSNVCSTDEGC